jgi:hypothetical protein
VLSEVLSDPVVVLSNSILCCPSLSAGDQNGSRLRGLLILVVVRLREFDGEEGLDTGVQVEGFALPAGPDRCGVGVVEAVHRSELITLRSLLLCSAAGEVEMPCQILITKPGLTGLPIGFGEQPAIRTLADRHTAFVDGGVVPLT